MEACFGLRPRPALRLGAAPHPSLHLGAAPHPSLRLNTAPRPALRAGAALRRLVPLLLLRCAAPLAAPKQAAAPSDAERYANRAAPGAMVRPPMAFRARVGDAAHPAAAGRYRLYLSDACPCA